MKKLINYTLKQLTCVLFLLFVDQNMISQIQAPDINKAVCAGCGAVGYNPHKTTCIYYTCPNCGTRTKGKAHDCSKKQTPLKQESPVDNEPLKNLNSAIDLLTTPTETKPKIDEVKQKEDAEKNKKIQAEKDEKHKKTISQIKSFDEPKTTKKDIVLTAACDGDEVEVKFGTEWRKLDCKNGIAEMKVGEIIKTGPNSKAFLNIDGHRVLVDPSSQFAIPSLEKSFLDLFYGKIRVLVYKKFSKKFEVRTNSFAMAVRGTQFTTEVFLDGKAEVQLFEGEIEIETTGSHEKLILTPGKKVKITADGKIDTIEKFEVKPTDLEPEEK